MHSKLHLDWHTSATCHKICFTTCSRQIQLPTEYLRHLFSLSLHTETAKE